MNGLDNKLDHMSDSKKSKIVKKYYEEQYLYKHHKISKFSSTMYCLISIGVLSVFIYCLNVCINNWLTAKEGMAASDFIDAVSIILPIHFSYKLTNIAFNIDYKSKYGIGYIIIIVMCALVFPSILNFNAIAKLFRFLFNYIK